ncbi:MAG: 4-hydroxy-3-methylbut-2-enyl diphosphate reductase [Actinomycetota bacterium]|nr:4-hydroxy-3-methylbut-2-enyl diphosphate reductase [Actinomycetota bacterium]
MTPVSVSQTAERKAALVLPLAERDVPLPGDLSRARLGPVAVVVAVPAGHQLAPEARPGDVVVPDPRHHLGDRVLGAVVVADLLRHGVRVHQAAPWLGADPFDGAVSDLRGSEAGPDEAGSDGFPGRVGERLARRGPRGVVVLGVVLPLGAGAQEASPGLGATDRGWGPEDLPAAVRQGLDRWAGALGARQVLLAAPRSFCAGVQRAVEIVQRAIDRYGAPVYVRRQIVHNAHVVNGLRERGAVFVEELGEVPDGATVVLAAHGVAPWVRGEAEARRLTVVDATCPLVAKVHREARRFAADGRRIVLVGHAEHEEVEGTVGEAPDAIEVVASEAEVASLPGSGERPMAYLTQTTLAVDETTTVIDALRRRFPGIVGPAADDICYATQNRQDAVRAMAARCQLMLVVGSANSSNTARLVEVAHRQGCRAELVEDETELRWEWLYGVEAVGVTAGASAPEALVQRLVGVLASLGPVSVSEHRTAAEHVHFSLPPQVR